MIYIAVFLISASSLCYEVLLTRVFSIGQWNHLSFMVISIALFGFGASGTFLAIRDTRKKGWEKRLSRPHVLKLLMVVYSFTALFGYLALNRLPLDYFRLPLEPAQALYLLIAYLLLALPFFFTGMIISTGFAAVSHRAGLIYCASMGGSALGALIPALMLGRISEGPLVVGASLLPLVFLLLPSMKKDQGPSGILSWVTYPAGLMLLLAALYFTQAGDGKWIEVTPSPYKALRHLMRFPDTRVVKTVPNIRGRLDRVESPHIRFAPGLSLKYTQRPPKQDAVFRDADNPFRLYHLAGETDTGFCQYLLSHSGYLMAREPERVLVVQQGGGTAIPEAIQSGATDITVIEGHPDLAQMVKDHYPIAVINDTPRSHLAGSDRKYDVIHIEDWGASVPGTAALNQQHILTVDAFFGYIRHLKKNGVVIVGRKLLLPPADMLRLWATVREALARCGKQNPDRHLAILRNWDIFTLLVFSEPLLDTETLRRFADSLNFDLVYLPDIRSDEVNRFNVYDEPYHYREIQHLKAAYQKNRQDEFFDRYPLDIVPQTDNRPFPSRFLKWSHMRELYESTGSRLHGMLLSSEIVVAVVFVEAVLVAVFLLAIPIFTMTRSQKGSQLFTITFFFSVGAGFMFMELYFIKLFTLLFDDSVIAFTVVLSGIMVFSGAGGYLSERLGTRAMKGSLVLVVLHGLGFFLLSEKVVAFSLPLNESLRYLIAYIILLPAGLLMGIPFSLGMRLMLGSALDRAYAWCANGCASVLTSILSAQIALSFGIGAILPLALAAYTIALVASWAKTGRASIQNG